MLIIFKSALGRDDRSRVERVAVGLGGQLEAVPMEGAEAVLITGPPEARSPELYEMLPGVSSVLPVAAPLRRVARRHA